jgi:hypothetical protein
MLGIDASVGSPVLMQLAQRRRDLGRIAETRIERQRPLLSEELREA